MQEESSYLMSLLLSYVVPIVLMVGLLVFLMRRMGGGMGAAWAAWARPMPRSTWRKATGVTFTDVAGQDEAKESLVEIIDFSTTPSKYTEIGAKLPKGAPCWWARRAPARPCWPRPWPARPTSPSSPSPAPTLWRCSWAWAPPGPGPVQGGQQGGPLHRFHRRDRHHRQIRTTAWAATTSGSRP